MKIIAGLKAAAESITSPRKAHSYTVAGKKVVCVHCENILFHKERASLNTASSSMCNTEWMDHEAHTLICANCSRIEWFYDDPTENEEA